MYIGSTQDFKERLANHKASFRHEKLKKETVLSQYVWSEGLNPEPEISWTILKKGSIYKKGTRYCDICLSEKYSSQNMKNTRTALIREQILLQNVCIKIDTNFQD